MASALKNVSSWRLNSTEKEELKRRVADGEDETAVTRELQTKKAQAAHDRKMAAVAVADRSKQVQQASQASQAKQKSVKQAKAPGNVAEHDACNKAYYECVQRDVTLILKEFGNNLADEAPLAIVADGDSGVQEPFDKEKAKIALSKHGVYRCSISAFQINVLSSATPSIPMSRRRTMDYSEFHHGATGEPKFGSDRMVELGVSKTDIDCERPSNLQMLSPEELLHATFAACAGAIELLVNVSELLVLVAC